MTILCKTPAGSGLRSARHLSTQACLPSESPASLVTSPRRFATIPTRAVSQSPARTQSSSLPSEILRPGAGAADKLGGAFRHVTAKERI